MTRPGRCPGPIRLRARLIAMTLATCLLTTPAGVHATAPDATGPRSGPPAQAGQSVLALAYDLKNGGIARTTRGLLGASRALGWQISVVDGKGDPATVRQILHKAMTTRTSGIAFIGADSADYHAELLSLRQAGKVLVGWHAGPNAGPNAELFTNVTTDPASVARAAADYAIQTTPGRIGAIILTDPTFAIARLKADRIRAVLEHCKRCEVLQVENLPIIQINTGMAARVAQWNQRYGRRWTHVFAINDSYFDTINFPLYRAGRQDIIGIAAGDGSSPAVRRIRLGLSQQKASVAEPCDQQGWQIADEMNRAFAGQRPSGFVSRPILVTKARLAGSAAGSGDVEPDTGYRARYLEIWKIRPPATP